MAEGLKEREFLAGKEEGGGGEADDECDTPMVLPVMTCADDVIIDAWDVSADDVICTVPSSESARTGFQEGETRDWGGEGGEGGGESSRDDAGDCAHNWLTGAVLTGAVLTGAVYDSAELTGAVYGSAVLTGAESTGAVLTGAVLTGAVYGSAVLTGAESTGAVLTGAVLTGAVYDSAVGVACCCKRTASSYEKNDGSGGGSVSVDAPLERIESVTPFASAFRESSDAAALPFASTFRERSDKSPSLSSSSEPHNSSVAAS